MGRWMSLDRAVGLGRVRVLAPQRQASASAGAGRSSRPGVSLPCGRLGPERLRLVVNDPPLARGADDPVDAQGDPGR